MLRNTAHGGLSMFRTFSEHMQSSELVLTASCRTVPPSGPTLLTRVHWEGWVEGGRKEKRRGTRLPVRARCFCMRSENALNVLDPP